MSRFSYLFCYILFVLLSPPGSGTHLRNRDDGVLYSPRMARALDAYCLRGRLADWALVFHQRDEEEVPCGEDFGIERATC